MRVNHPKITTLERLATLKLTKSISVVFFQLETEPYEKTLTSEDWSKRLEKSAKKSNYKKSFETMTASTPGVYAFTYSDREFNGKVEIASESTIRLGGNNIMPQSSVNPGTGDRAQVSAPVGHELLDESFVKFFDNNVFGIVRPSLAAPSHSMVARWINEASPAGRNSSGDKILWRAVPLMDQKAYEDIKHANEIRWVHFSAAPGFEVPTASTDIGALVNAVRGVRPGLALDVKLSNKKRKSKEDFRGIVEEMYDLGSSEEGISKAKVGIRKTEGAKTEAVNIIKERISVRHEVELEEGTSRLNAQDVFKAIKSSYDEKMGRIRSAS